MTVAQFLAAFQDLDESELTKLRRSERLASWTQDPDFYLALTKELFCDPGTFETWEERSRFVQILREMVYTDGRTLTSLLYIADAATKYPEYDINGINSLAGIYCFFYSHGALNHAHLLDTFRRLAKTPALENNANQCARLITQGPFPQPS